MRVYVSPCGVGLGHIVRSAPIADELRSRGAEIVYSTYLDGLEYARARGFRLMESVPISFRVKNDGTVDFKQTAARSGLSLGLRRFLKQVRTEIRNMKRFRPDAVFSDSRASSIIAARLLGVPVILMLNQLRVEIIRRPSSGRLTPMERLFFLLANIFWIFVRTVIIGVWGQSQLILIPDYPLPHTISLDNLTIPSRYKAKIRYIGPIVDVSQTKLPSSSEIVRELMLPDDRPKVYAAISGPRTERIYLVKLLLSILPDLSNEFYFVVSCGDPKGKTNPKATKNVLLYEWMDDRTQFVMLKAADVIICRSGHGTITKGLSFGKPLILIPTPDHTEQYGNAKRMVQLGAAIMLDQKTLTKEKLSDSIRTILNSQRYKVNAGNLGEETLRLNPIKTAADIIMKAAQGNESGLD